MTNYSNALRLCPLCHSTFGDMLNPGWVFFSIDLDFFFFYRLRAVRPQGLGSISETTFGPGQYFLLEPLKGDRCAPPVCKIPDVCKVRIGTGAVGPCRVRYRIKKPGMDTHWQPSEWHGES